MDLHLLTIAILRATKGISHENLELRNQRPPGLELRHQNKRTEVKLSYERIREIFYTDNPEMFDEEDERFDIKRSEK